MQPDQLLDSTTNVGFTFCIAAEKPGAPAGYRAERMRSYLAHHGDAQADTGDARFMLMIAPTPPAPLADADSHPDGSEAVQRQHEARIACALQSIDRETPLLEGETVENDEFTFLTAPFNGAPERTAVLRRTTNFGELLYLFAGVTVAPAGRLLFEDASSAAPPRVASAAAPVMVGDSATTEVEELVSTFAKAIATELLTSVGGALAGGLLDAIFPPGVPSYFGEVYRQIKRVVGTELDQSLIDQINGAINNIKVHLQTEYRPAKKGKDLDRFEDRKVLFDLLQKYEATYVNGPGGMLGTLMADRCAKPGFGAFLVGAGLHLMLFQEMANVDPNNRSPGGKFRGPLESSYGLPETGTVAQTARLYAEFAEKTWPAIRDDRKAKIHQKEATLCAFGDTTGGTCRTYAWFRDDQEPGSQYLPGRASNDANRVNEIVQATSDKNGNNPGRDRLIQSYNSYVDRKVQELTTSLKDPAAIAAAWRTLIKTPIKPA